jgi:hypothetical protein
MSSHFSAWDCGRKCHYKGKMTLEGWSCSALSNPPKIRVEGLRKTGTISETIFGLQAQIRVPYHPPAVYSPRGPVAFLTESIITGSMYIHSCLETSLLCWLTWMVGGALWSVSVLTVNALLTLLQWSPAMELQRELPVCRSVQWVLGRAKFVSWCCERYSYTTSIVKHWLC